MKLLSQFKNRYNNITYKIYETNNGVKVLHLDNPATINFDLAVIHSAGSAFEIQQGVPRGTAHFLEHMLFNPNTYFRSLDDINRFEQGNKERPTLHINAYTHKKYIMFVGHTNEKGTDRIFERIEKIYDFPKEKFTRYINKERNVILAEKSRKRRKKDNNTFMFLDFMFKGIADEFSGDVLGEEEDIKAITINDLEKYYKNKILSGTSVISIQSNGEFNDEIVNRIEKLSSIFSNRENKNLRDITIKNNWRVGVFSDKKENGISIYFEYFYDLKKKVDYKHSVVSFLSARLLDWLGHNILREKKGLIYSFSLSKNNAYSFKYNIYEYGWTTEKDKFVNTLEEYYTLLYVTTFKFLNSKKGKEWFEDAISTYIFPKTASYDPSLAEGVAMDLLEDRELFNYNLAVKQAKSISIKDIEVYIKEQIEIPPHIWIEGDIDKKEARDIVKNSSFGKKFN